MCVNSSWGEWDRRISLKGGNQKSSFEERRECKLAGKRIRYVYGFSTQFTTQSCTPYRASERPLQALDFSAAKTLQRAAIAASSAPPSSHRRSVTAPDPGCLTEEAALGRWMGAVVGRLVSQSTDPSGDDHRRLQSEAEPRKGWASTFTSVS